MNPALRSACSLLGFLVFGLGSSSCVLEGDLIDYWSEVMPACDYLIEGGTPLDVSEKARSKTTLRPECREALELALPLDESLDLAPPGMKDRVLEAFQILAAYPLALPPEGRILEVAPASIPAAQLCMLGAPECPAQHRPSSGAWEAGNYRKNLFNLVANSFDLIGYDPDGAGDLSARNDFELGAGLNGRSLWIHSLFWSEDAVSELTTGPFGRAAILVHEAAHSGGVMHTHCGTSEGFACDADLGGAHGFSIVYRTLLLRGSGDLQLESGAYVLSKLDLMNLGLQNCRLLKERIDVLPPGLEALVTESGCQGIGARWIVEREDLERDDFAD
jgi:hypothetical protein